MKRDDLQHGLARILDPAFVPGVLFATYLRTYSRLLSLAKFDHTISSSEFCQVAALSYTWMPRVVRLFSDHLYEAASLLEEARTAMPADIVDVDLRPIVCCLHSVVGTSKVLHFVNPSVFPIWDSRVERTRLGYEPPYRHMREVRNYRGYVAAVYEAIQSGWFTGFRDEFQQAHDSVLE